MACGTGVYADTIRTLGWFPIGQLHRAATVMPVVVADATRLVVQPGSVAAVASVLCDTDVDDYAAVCRAAAAALTAGGRFAHVGVHPCFCGAFVDRSNPEHLITRPGYWRRDHQFAAWSPNGVRARVGATYLPLSDLIAAVTAAGLILDTVIEAGEPTPDVLAIQAPNPATDQCRFTRAHICRVDRGGTDERYVAAAQSVGCWNGSLFTPA